MAKPVLEPSEDAIVDALLDIAREALSKLAVHGGPGLVGRLEQKRKIDDSQFGDAIGQIAARLVAERQKAMLDQPQNVLGAVAEVHDVPHILDVDLVAELRDQTIADHLQGAAEARRGRAVAAHAN